MEWLTVTLRLYRTAFARAAHLTVANWAVMLTVFVYVAVLRLGTMAALSAGILGGFLLSLLFAACASSFLAVVEAIIRTSRVSLADFRSSFGTYLWDVVGVTFVAWIASRFLTPALLALPQGLLIVACAWIAVFVFFNAVPELIYLGRCTVLQLFGESYTFIADNWLEWFPANLALYGVVAAIAGVQAPAPASFVLDAALALFAYFAMIVRGLLFLELHGSTHRSRAFKYRAG